MTESRIKPRRWALPLAGIAAAAVAGGAAVQLVSTPQGAAQAQSAEQPVNPPSFADVVERSSPAVVNISVTQVREAPQRGDGEGLPRGFPRSPLEEFFGRFFDMPGTPDAPQRPQPPRRSEGAGSGFVVDASGYIVTNHHVVANAEDIVVTFQDGTRLDASVVGEDQETDLALLQVDSSEDLPFVRFGDSDDARVGEWVLTIGNPFGLGGSASAGIVSARGRQISPGPYDDYLQIDAPINRGNSGGPVFNANGEVIGVSTAIFSPNGGNIGIGFAIPSNQAASVITQLREGGTVERGWLGVQIQPVDEGLAEAFGLEEARGALIAEVVEGSPAARAGLEPGDVVTQLDGSEVDSVRALSVAVAERGPGEEVEVTVRRGEETLTFDVALGDRAQASADGSGSGPRGGDSRDGGDAAEALGLQLRPLTDRERAQLDLPDDVAGVLVANVQPGSPAAEEGVRPGEVIVQINRRPVRSVDEAAAALREARGDDGRVLLLLRGPQGQRFVALSAP